MNRSRSNERNVPATVAVRACGAALLCLVIGSSDAQAYGRYNNAGTGCVQCHDGFVGGPQYVLHFAHTNNFGITECNFCHPAGGGSLPVRTYSSGPGGGYGCTGCHGQDYGELSFYGGLPKSTGYGLREVHAAKGVTVCANCHVPGAYNSPNPFPAMLPESTPPPYYLMPGSDLTNPCDSNQEDLATGEITPDSVGLDNDGNGLADWPNDPSCAQPATTTTTITTTTTTLAADCAPVPIVGCIAAGKGMLLVDEKTAGKEKLKVSLTKLVPAVSQSQFGDPVADITSYAVCIYNASNVLAGAYTVDRGTENCEVADLIACWSPVKTTGYKYLDKHLAADGIMKMLLAGGDAGKGKIKVSGKNDDDAPSLPTGVAALLNGASEATVQVVSSDADCFGMTLNQVKTADGASFSATGP